MGSLPPECPADLDEPGVAHSTAALGASLEERVDLGPARILVGPVDLEPDQEAVSVEPTVEAVKQVEVNLERERAGFLQESRPLEVGFALGPVEKERAPLLKARGKPAHDPEDEGHARRAENAPGARVLEAALDEILGLENGRFGDRADLAGEQRLDLGVRRLEHAAPALELELSHAIARSGLSRDPWSGDLRQVPRRHALRTVPSELAQRSGDVILGDALAPRQVQVGVVERPRALRELVGPLLDQVVRQLAADEGARVRDDGARADRAEDEPGFLDHFSHHASRGADGEDREVERAPPAALQVGRAPARVRGDVDLREDLVGALGQVHDPVVGEQRVERDRALALARRQRHARAEGQERRRRVGRGDGPAAGRAGSDPADSPVLLHAEVDRLAPLVGLIVVVAASVEAEVAAERPHVAEMRCRDRESRFCERRVGFSQALVRSQLGQREVGTQSCGPVHRRSAQDLDPLEPDDDLGRLLAALHVRPQVGPAGHDLSLSALVGEDRARRREIARADVPEPRESHHEVTAFFFGFLVSCSLVARPSPPSQGGGTIDAVGQAILGKAFGPKRPMPPLAFSSSALRIFSGVIGTSSTRTPTAS